MEENFCVNDTSSANWVLKKIAEEKKQLKEIKRIEEEEIHTIKKWASKEAQQHESSIDFFEGLLMRYLVNEKKKKISLPFGKISFKKQQPSYGRDVPLLLKQVDEKYIKVSKTLDWSSFKKVIACKTDDNNKKIIVNKETGEILEGITIEERPDEFQVTITE